MTIAPQPPALDVVPNESMMEVAESHLTIVKLGLGYSLLILIKKGFRTDGASVPKEEIEDSRIAQHISKLIALHYPGKDYKQTLEYLIGTPFEMPRLLAAVVHDALYGIHWMWRWACDKIYKKILDNLGYDPVRKDIEYSGIRLLGWKNWDAVTKHEQKATKQLVDVRFVRSANVVQEIAAIAESSCRH